MTLHEAYQKVISHFNGDMKKALEWFNNEIFFLGNKSPNELIRKGQYEKVIKYINENFK